MARYLRFTVNVGTVFPKNVLEAFGLQKSKSGIYFYQGCVIIVPYFELLCNYPKIPQRKNYEIQGVNRFSKIYFLLWRYRGLYFHGKCGSTVAPITP